MNTKDAIYVAGHRGLVGSALVRALRQRGYQRIVSRDRAELDLRDATAVRAFFREERPAFVFVAAAKVGGILANASSPADFIRDNLAIALNVIDEARQAGVAKLLFLSSSCVYPKHAPQPLKESYLLTGPLEPTNEPYAIAKLAGMKLCEAYYRQYGVRFLSVLPTNLYGPNDNFDLESGHVLPALIRRIHEAKVRGDSQVRIWGTGTPRREFLHVDDLADACIFLMQTYEDPAPVNIGCGHDLSIAGLAELVADVVNFDGSFNYDSSKPDGTPRKLLDTTRLDGLGWRPRVELRTGIEQTYDWYLRHVADAVA